jgi:hypothetical protein
LFAGLAISSAIAAFAEETCAAWVMLCTVHITQLENSSALHRTAGYFRSNFATIATLLLYKLSHVCVRARA